MMRGLPLTTFLTLPLLLTLSTVAQGNELSLRFRPLFEDLPIGDIVFYEVSVTNHSGQPVTIERPCVGRNIDIQIVGLADRRRMVRFTNSGQEPPEPSGQRDENWILQPGQSKSHVVLVQLWADRMHLFRDLPIRNLNNKGNMYTVFVHTQPLGAYRNNVIRFAPLTQTFPVGAAVLPERFMLQTNLISFHVAKNGVDLNDRLLPFRGPNENAVADGLVQQGFDSLLRRHCQWHQQLRKHVQDNTSEIKLQTATKRIINKQPDRLRAWYEAAIRRELGVLQDQAD